ncbi:MAG: SIS domain-containing protein [Bryobacterales bacterium]|nr:SIS domain-containing protein [Bryobacterales bacterium]
MLYPAVILAGGLGTRLGELTKKTPKSLVEVNGVPFIAHQLRLLRAQGITRVILCVGHLCEQIEQFVGDGRRFGVEATYSFDGPAQLGTAGAIVKALALLPERFFVIYGDSYLPEDYAAAQRAFDASGRRALMTVFHNDDLGDVSNVEFAGGEIVVYDKKNKTPRMKHIDYGLGLFARSVFEELPAGPVDLAKVYQDLHGRGDLAALEVHRRFYEVGSVAGIEELSGVLRGEEAMSFSKQFFNEAKEILDRIDIAQVEKMAEILAGTRAAGGRLFMLGVGGSAANASHAVNDFRKIVGIETYAPTDNVSELTARTNDEGWATIFESWLRTSKLRSGDTIFVLSVGGGNMEKNVSPNLVAALEYARSVKANIIGIVGRDGGHTAKVADACAIIPTVNPVHVTPHAEAFQAVVWHMLVSHPSLKAVETKWESVK